MFTVMGITGKVGGAVAENLLAAGKTVRCVVRDSRKAKAWADRGVELVQSAYDDAAGLAKAFSGAEGIFAMIPPDFDRGVRTGAGQVRRTGAGTLRDNEFGNSEAT
jgi:NAD(P)H dehydrogenase (quinone)